MGIISTVERLRFKRQTFHAHYVNVFSALITGFFTREQTKLTEA